jgi:zinc protease
MRTIAEQYGNLPGRELKKRDILPEPKQGEDRFAELTHSKATQPMIAKAWHIPPMTHPDYPALAILGKLLSSGKSALLNERLLYASKVTEVFADAYMSRDMGTFEFFAQLASDVPFDEVERVFADTVGELAAGAISGDQMEVVKNATKR